MAFWARFGGMECNEFHTCVPWGLSSTMDVTSSVFQACLPPLHDGMFFSVIYIVPSHLTWTLLLWHEWKFPCTTIYRDEPGERRGEKCSETRSETCGEKCGEKRSEKRSEKFYRRKTACWDLSRLFSFQSRGFVGNPLSWPLSPEIWQCRRLSLSAVQPIVEHNAAECAKGLHPPHSLCYSD